MRRLITAAFATWCSMTGSLYAEPKLVVSHSNQESSSVAEMDRVYELLSLSALKTADASNWIQLVCVQLD
jgi:hypothetical protein